VRAWFESKAELILTAGAGREQHAAALVAATGGLTVSDNRVERDDVVG